MKTNEEGQGTLVQLICNYASQDVDGVESERERKMLATKNQTTVSKPADIVTNRLALKLINYQITKQIIYIPPIETTE